MIKLKLTSIESGTEMDDIYFANQSKQLFQSNLPNINENIENENVINTPSMIMSSNSDRPSLYNNNSNVSTQSITVSTRTSRWHQSIKNKQDPPNTMSVNEAK